MTPTICCRKLGRTRIVKSDSISLYAVKFVKELTSDQAEKKCNQEWVRGQLVLDSFLSCGHISWATLGCQEARKRERRIQKCALEVRRKGKDFIESHEAQTWAGQLGNEGYIEEQQMTMRRACPRDFRKEPCGGFIQSERRRPKININSTIIFFPSSTMSLATMVHKTCDIPAVMEFYCSGEDSRQKEISNKGTKTWGKHQVVIMI